ncbi:RE2, partial [Symbiodinium sp. KB8]
IVFGKNPRDEADLQFEVEEGGGQLLRTADDAQRRREAIRNAARIAFYQVRTEDKVRRGMSQKARVKPRDLENGSMVLFWRKPANKKNGLWKGPGTIIGRQEDNYWVSHGGRCYLCDDLLRLVENNYDDPEVFPGDGAPEEDQAYLDDILADLSMAEEAYMLKQSKRQLFIDAEHKQWEEHLRLGALRPLSLKESLDKKDCGRILSSRFAYRDKNLAKRRADATVEWKAKSRLVVSGHTDPDIASGALRTDSPTVSRTAVMCLLQMAASRTDENWGVSAGDVTAAFLNGEKLDRELYLKQPKHGLPGLHPDQLIKVEKGVFGLIDSPRKWWKKFKKDIQELTIILHNDKKAKFYASALDPCVFQLVELDDEGTRGNGTPLCYAAVHVDDILLVAERGVRDLVQKQLSTCFPVDEWEQDVFDFIGSHIETKPEGIFVSQSSYAANRLFEVEVSPSMPDDVPANPEQIADNRSLVGALSWLASQSRPDLACGVSMCQQLQAKPNIGDLRFSNLMARRALLHKDEGIFLAKVPLNEIVFTVFHDAGWSNAPDSNADPVYFLYSEDERNGIIEEGPWVNKKRKTKKKNSSVASQLGALVTVHGKVDVRSRNYGVY